MEVHLFYLGGGGGGDEREGEEGARGGGGGGSHCRVTYTFLLYPSPTPGDSRKFPMPSSASKKNHTTISPLYTSLRTFYANLLPIHSSSFQPPALYL